MTSWTLLLTSASLSNVFLSAVGDRQLQQDPVEQWINENELGKPFYNQDGPIGEIIDRMDKANADIKKAAKKWAQGSFEALKGARRVLVQSTNKAQNVLLHDALHAQGAIRGDFHNKIDDVEIDRDLVGPTNLTDDLTPKWQGIEVEINRKNGINDREVSIPESPIDYRGKKGLIVGYNAKRGSWKVKPLDDGMPPVDLHIGDFSISDEEGEGAVPGLYRYPKDKQTEKMLRERSKEMLRYARENQHVVIDRLPDAVERNPKDINWPRIEDAFKHSSNRIGKVVNYSPALKKFQIQTQNDSGDYENDSANWPWLEEDKHFHRIKDLEGLQVESKRPWTGEVGRWKPGPNGGSYKVKFLGAPEDEISLSHSEVKDGVRAKGQAWQKESHEVDGDLQNLSHLVNRMVRIQMVDGPGIRGTLTEWDDDRRHNRKKLTVVGVKDGETTQKTFSVYQGQIRELQVLGNRESTPSEVLEDEQAGQPIQEAD